MRAWVLFLLFLGLPLAEGERAPADEADLWLMSGIDSAFISRFIRNDLCRQNEQWVEACQRGLQRGIRFLAPSDAGSALRADWEKEKPAKTTDFESYLNRLAATETAAPKAMVWGYMANHVMATFDPFARIWPDGFFETVGTGSHNEVGTGAQFEILEEAVVARRVFKGSPAELAGIRVGDRLLAVNGDAVRGGAEALDSLFKLRGQAGVLVKLELQRGGVASEKTLRLERIAYPDSALSYVDLLNRRHAVITIYSFTRGICERVQQQVRTAVERNSVAVILDLRFNPGGLSSEGLCLARIFTGESELIRYNFFTASLLPGELELRPRILAAMPVEEPVLMPAVQDTAVPLAVLVNAGTASIAEIAAAALQDTGRAWLVGIGTMGKGTFQLNASLSFNKRLRLRHSIAEAVRINETVVQGAGVTPNFESPFQFGESLTSWRLTQDKAFVPHPIPSSGAARWTEPRAEQRSAIDRCARAQLAGRYSRQLKKQLGFEDFQQALAMAVLQCDGDLKVAN